MTRAPLTPQNQDAGSDARAPKTRIFYRFWRILAQLVLRVVYRVEVIGLENVPLSGACLIAANHQSFLDPPLVGGFVERELKFVARSGLFRSRPFAWLITNLNAIAIREDSGDIGAIKQVVHELDEGRGVVIYPEGARTENGAMIPFKRGIALLVKRAKCPVLPVAIEGGFDTWRRRQLLPSIWGKRLAVKYGRAIPHDELMSSGPDEALRRLEREIDVMRLELRSLLRTRTNGRYPAPGAGDQPINADANPSADQDAAT
jgi:1-acyl-sn-glycerol-3-phosphate acyltransferase